VFDKLKAELAKAMLSLPATNVRHVYVTVIESYLLYKKEKKIDLLLIFSILFLF
jgi:hypothetical protein